MLSHKARDIWTGTPCTMPYNKKHSAQPIKAGEWWSWAAGQHREATRPKSQNHCDAHRGENGDKDKKTHTNKQTGKQRNKQKMKEEGRGLRDFILFFYYFVVVLFGWSFVPNNRSALDILTLFIL
jgi:hypothetical protein